MAYDKETKNVTATSAKTVVINFVLNGIPVPKVSDASLDFGLDSMKSFAISNIGTGTLSYVITVSRMS